jgi:pilus assembly protein CpaC
MRGRGFADGGAQRTFPNPHFVAAFVALLVCLGLPTATSPAQAQSDRVCEGERESSRQIVLTLNKSRTVCIHKSFATAMVGSPDIADVLPMSDHSLYIQGKKVGTTNLSVFDSNQKLISVIDLEVAIDSQSLREKIVSATGSRGIRVSSSNGQIVLSGQVKDAVVSSAA